MIVKAGGSLSVDRSRSRCYNAPMLIGIDASRALRARRTGTENYSLQLIRHLLALDSGHRFRLYCDRPLPAAASGYWNCRQG